MMDCHDGYILWTSIWRGELELGRHFVERKSDSKLLNPISKLWVTTAVFALLL